MKVEIGFDLAANGVGNWFTLDDATKGVLDSTTYLLAGDVLVDVTSDLRAVQVRRGRSRTLDKFTAGNANVTLDNRDRMYDPTFRPTYVRDILGSAVWWIDAQLNGSDSGAANFGTGGAILNAAQGTTANQPKFLDYTGGTPYVYLPGVASNYLSVPDEAALDITGDIDIRVRVALDDWTPAVTHLVAKRTGATSTTAAYTFSVLITGALSYSWFDSGTGAFRQSDSTVAPTVSDGAPLWVRVTMDADNGAGGNDVKFYTSSDGASWTQLGATVTTATIATMAAGTSPVEIGSRNGGTASLATGKFYRAQVLNGINGSTVLDIDTSVLTSGAATSFLALTGQTVTVNRSTSGRKSVAVVAPCWLFGTDDYLEVPDNDLLDFGATDSFTVIGVVRSWGTAAGIGISKKISTSAANVGWYLGLASWQSRISDGVTQPAINGTAPAAGSIVSLAFTVDRSVLQLATVYTGTLPNATSSVSTVGSVSNAEVMRVGRFSGAGVTYADMELVAAAVFRRALTAAEIAAISTYYSTRPAAPMGGLTVSGITSIISGTGTPYYGSIVPRKQVVISHNDETIYSGSSEDWNFGYTLNGDSTAEVSCVDGLSILASTTRTGGTATAQATGARVGAVLDEIGWPSTLRSISTGQATLDADVVPPTDNALAYLQKVEVSEPGALFIGKSGNLTFRDRADLQAFTSGVTFGTGGIPFYEIGVVYGTEEMTNTANVIYSAGSAVGGTATATDATAITSYGVMEQTYDTLLASQSDAETFATWIVGLYSQPQYRVDSIGVNLAGITSAQVNQVLALELGDTVLVTWTPNNAGSAISQYVSIDGIEHDATPSSHVVKFTMSESTAAFLLDSATFGVLDQNILGF